MQGRRDLDQERARALSLEMEQQRTLDRATHARTPDGASRLLAHTAASVQKTASVTSMMGGMMTSVSVSVSESSPAPTTAVHVPVVPLPVDGTSRLLAHTTASAQKTALKSGGGGGGGGGGGVVVRKCRVRGHGWGRAWGRAWGVVVCRRQRRPRLCRRSPTPLCLPPVLTPPTRHLQQ